MTKTKRRAQQLIQARNIAEFIQPHHVDVAHPMKGWSRGSDEILEHLVTEFARLDTATLYALEHTIKHLISRQSEGNSEDRAKHIGPDEMFYADPEECEGEWDYFNHMMDKDD